MIRQLTFLPSCYKEATSGDLPTKNTTQVWGEGAVPPEPSLLQPDRRNPVQPSKDPVLILIYVKTKELVDLSC